MKSQATRKNMKKRALIVALSMVLSLSLTGPVLAEGEVATAIVGQFSRQI